MGTLRWFERLGILLKPTPVVDQNPAGRIVSAQVVNDAGYLSSREGNPWALYSVLTATPAAGNHAAVAITTRSPATHGIGIHRLMISPASAELINMAFVNYAAITWVAAQTTLVSNYADLETDSLLIVRHGTIAAANLPTTSGVWDASPNSSVPWIEEANAPMLHNPQVRAADTILFWDTIATNPMIFNAKAQAIRL